MSLEISFEDIESARATIHGRVDHTPLVRSRWLTGQSGLKTWLKAENLQVTRSFKVRGALNKLAHLSAEERERGVITASTGNHGLAVAYAASEADVPSWIVLPESATQAKITAAKEYGAQLVLHGPHYGVADQRAWELADENGFTYIDSVIDPYILAGYGTTAIDIVEDLPEVDAVVLPIGGGGCASAMATALAHLKPDVRIVGVEAEGCGLYWHSRQQGKPAELGRVETIADGLRVDTAHPVIFEAIERLVDDIVLVSDEELLAAMRCLAEREGLVAEPAGAATTAAVLADKVVLPEGNRTVVLVSGGSVDAKS